MNSIDDLAEFADLLRKVDSLANITVKGFKIGNDKLNELNDKVEETNKRLESVEKQQEETNKILREGFSATNKLLEKMLERLDKVEVSISKLADMEARLERIEKVVFKAS